MLEKLKRCQRYSSLLVMDPTVVRRVSLAVATAAVSGIAGAWILRWLFGSKEPAGLDKVKKAAWPDYTSLRAFALSCGSALPCMFVNLDAFDANTDAFAAIARAAGKTLRLATKSIRVPWLVERVLNRHPDVFRGLMCFCVREAAFWTRTRGLLDVFVAYPTVDPGDLALAAALAAEGAAVSLAVDCEEHVGLVEAALELAAARSDRPVIARRLGLVIDMDVSLRPLGGAAHVGAHRSPCRSADAVAALARRILGSPACAAGRLALTGAMGYEAHVAGLPEWAVEGARAAGHWPWPVAAAAAAAWAAIVRVVKAVSMPDVVAQRARAAAALAAAVDDAAPWPAAEPRRRPFFNGGGSGNCAAACADASLTEVSVGSGLLQSHIFDGFAACASLPALAFALSISRVPSPGVVCCHSGGFVASGAPGWDKAPVPLLPAGLVPFHDEGYGEVQTPLAVGQGAAFSEAQALRIGDPVFFRPAKAGEIAERFEHHVILGSRSGSHSLGGQSSRKAAEETGKEGGERTDPCGLQETPLQQQVTEQVGDTRGKGCRPAGSTGSPASSAPGRFAVLGRVCTYRGLGLTLY